MGGGIGAVVGGIRNSPGASGGVTEGRIPSSIFCCSGFGWGGCGEVGKALSDLPREENEALTLRYFEGLSYDEIAGRLGLTFSQVDHLIRKARTRLERRLRVRKRVVASS